MAIRLLLVDDSAFFMNKFKQILQAHKDIEVVGIANNGLEAVRLTKQLRPDVISMDYAMPIMDGLTAVKLIMQEAPSKILMLSALSLYGAKITLAALEAGALDFLPKNELSSATFSKKIRELHNTCLLNSTENVASNNAQNDQIITNLKSLTTTQKTSYKPKLLVIAASTGGPVALSQILQNLPTNFPAPIIVIQHMPAAFSLAFTGRLNEMCRLQVVEAKNGDKLQNGVVFVVPGGMQLLVKPNYCLKIITDNSYSYHPCADCTFSNLAQIFSGEVLAVVLTGMGADGMMGAKKLKASGNKIWAQNQETCTIYGMPAAVINANLADEIYPLEQISHKLIEEFNL